MKVMVLMIVVVFSCSIQNKVQEPQLKVEKQYLFGKYIVNAGSYNEESAIIIRFKGKIVFNSYGGDGRYVHIDTLQISKDKRMDFIFSYDFDDYTNLGMIVSLGINCRYKTISITDNLYKSQECNVPPEVDDQKIKDFVLIDVDFNGSKDIITNAIKNQNGSVFETECSKIILHKCLLELIH